MTQLDIRPAKRRGFSDLALCRISMAASLVAYLACQWTYFDLDPTQNGGIPLLGMMAALWSGGAAAVLHQRLRKARGATPPQDRQARPPR